MYCPRLFIIVIPELQCLLNCLHNIEVGFIIFVALDYTIVHILPRSVALQQLHCLQYFVYSLKICVYQVSS